MRLCNPTFFCKPVAVNASLHSNRTEKWAEKSNFPLCALLKDIILMAVVFYITSLQQMFLWRDGGVGGGWLPSHQLNHFLHPLEHLLISLAVIVERVSVMCQLEELYIHFTILEHLYDATFINLETCVVSFI